MAKIVYGKMPAPRELSQQIPASEQKLGCKAPGWGWLAKFLCKSPGCEGGEEMVIDEIDNCITL